MSREGTAPIAVYGATGYTGRLVAAELDRQGADYVLCGRNQAKLDELAGSLSRSPVVRAAALDDQAALRAAFEPCAAVIACAGPFSRYGEPVLSAAVDTATHYVDTTGEQNFMRLVFDRYGAPAAETGACLVSAMGFDYAPGDMLGALTAEGLGPLDEISFAYAVRSFGPSRGTTTTALGQMNGDDVEWREGRHQRAAQKVNRGAFEFPPPIGRQRMIRYPAGEQITVPRHVETAAVRTLLSASAVAPNPRLAGIAAATMPLAQLAMKTPARRLFQAAVARLPDGPDEADRKAARFTIVCDARRGTKRRRGVLRGTDVYGMTARATVEAASRMAAPGFQHKGALAPSEAFEPREFLATLRDYEVEYEIEENNP